MRRKKIVIVGAGISGLSLAFRLKSNPKLDVKVLEATSKPGGWINTLHTDAGLFELGPRGVRLRGESGAAFYKLVSELKLSSRLITSSSYSHRRYIYKQGALEEVVTNPFQWPFYKLTKPLLKALLLEPFQRAPALSDMSVEAFFRERFGDKVYENLIETALLGIFSVSGSYLSAKATFPKLWQIRARYSSLILGILAQSFSSFLLKKKQGLHSKIKIPSNLKKAALVSFQGGMSELISALALELKDLVHYNRGPLQVSYDKDKKKFNIGSQAGHYEADEVVIACSPRKIAGSLLDLPIDFNSFASEIGYKSIGLVSLGFKEEISKEFGFGYLVAPQLGENILGATIDSNTFLEHNKLKKTRITVIFDDNHERGQKSQNKYIQMATQALGRHLKLSFTPSFSAVNIAEKAMPIYRLGHHDRFEGLKMRIQNQNIPIHFTGHGYQSLSVSEAIFFAEQLAEKLQTQLMVK